MAGKRILLLVRLCDFVDIGWARIRSDELGALSILKVLSAAPGLFAFRARRYSILSFAFAAAVVCHCMLLDASAPPRFRGIT